MKGKIFIITLIILWLLEVVDIAMKYGAYTLIFTAVLLPILLLVLLTFIKNKFSNP